MKKLFVNFGVVATTAMPLASVVACGAQPSTYYYELDVAFVDSKLNVVLRHLPMENEISDDYKEEYRRRIYNDLGSRVVDNESIFSVKGFNIKYISNDYNGGLVNYEYIFATNNAPLRMVLTIPEHISDKRDENGEIVIIPTTDFHILHFSDFFREQILDHINQDSLLMTTPISDTISPARLTPEGYIINKIIEDFLEEI